MVLICWSCLSHTQWCSVWSHCIAVVQEMFECWGGGGGLLAQWLTRKMARHVEKVATPGLGYKKFGNSLELSYSTVARVIQRF